MSDEIYRPLIDDIVWSYSNLETFHDCKYRWFLKYIRRYKSEDKFYASYGLFMHTILEKFYLGLMSKSEMLRTFLMKFSTAVLGERPKDSIVQSYIKRGTEYLKSFEPLPYKVLAIEEKIDFTIGDNHFTCRIDYVGEDEQGNIIVVDNKSRDLKPRSTRKQPTLKDKELDSMLKQLYVYSAAIKEKYGKFPKYLCFNCFKANVFIKEQFDEQIYNETMKWVEDTIAEIKQTDDFYPNREYFACRYICGVSHECCYDIEARRTERRKYV